LVAQELKVSQHIPEVFLFGQCGAMAQDFVLPVDFILNTGISLVVIDLGTNDIVSGRSPEVIAQDVIRLARVVRQQARCIVGMLSIVPRSHKIGNLSYAEFCGRMCQVNTLVKQTVSGLSGIFFQRQKGFYELEIAGRKTMRCVLEWSKDGVHPNDEGGDGRARYKNSIRLAFSQALRLVGSLSKGCAHSAT